MCLSGTWVTSPNTPDRGTWHTSEQRTRSEGCTSSISTSAWAQMRVQRFISSDSATRYGSRQFGTSRGLAFERGVPQQRRTLLWQLTADAPREGHRQDDGSTDS